MPTSASCCTPRPRWSPSSARPGSCTCARICASRKTQNLEVIHDSIALSSSATSTTVIFDAEHFFDGFRDNPEFARRVSADRRRCRRRRRSASATPTAAGCRTRSPPRSTPSAQAVAGRRSASTATTIPSSAVANTLVAVAARRGAGAGHHQRHRRALRQRQPVLDRRQPAAEDGLQGASAPAQLRHLRELSHFVWRAGERRAQQAPAVRRPQRLRAQGRHARRRRAEESAAPTSTSIRRVVGNHQRVLVSDLSGRSNILYKAQRVRRRPRQPLKPAVQQRARRR